MNESLFQQVLDNRAKLSNKGKRINTERAVEMLRTRLTDLEAEGYESEVLMNLMMEKSWIGIKKEWLTMLKPRHLRAAPEVLDVVDKLIQDHLLKPPDQRKQAQADKVREDARAALFKITNARRE